MISRILTTFIVTLCIAIFIALLVIFQPAVTPEQIACFLIGIAASAVVAFSWTRLHGWIDAAIRPGQPQTIRLQTTETPGQITWAAIRATLTLFVFCLGLLMVFLMLMSRLIGVDFIDLLS